LAEKTLNQEDQILFHPELLVIPESGEPPYLTAYRCENCDSIWFPRLPVCPNCWNENLKKVPISRKGKLYSYTVMRVAAPPLKAPYVVGFADFPEGLRVCAQIEGDPDKLKCDMEMEVTTGVIRPDEASGKSVISYKLKPVN